MRSWRAVFLSLAIATLGAAEAPAQSNATRLALIIANETYTSAALGQLPGTRSDAEVMQPALEALGFEVTVRRNLNKIEMNRELREFARRLARLGREGVGFVYYAGHGMAEAGDNYLIGVEAALASFDDLTVEGYSLQEPLRLLSQANARAVIVVLDACRSTPGGRGDAARGWTPVPTSATVERSEMFIAFSTDYGATAADNGLYARVLAQELTRANSDIVEPFVRTQTTVARRTSRRQHPSYDDRLIERLALRPPTAEASMALMRGAVSDDLERFASGQMSEAERVQFMERIALLQFNASTQNREVADARDALVQLASNDSTAIRGAVGNLLHADSGEALLALERAVVSETGSATTLTALTLPADPSLSQYSPVAEMDRLMAPVSQRISIELRNPRTLHVYGARVQEGDRVQFRISSSVEGRIILVDRNAAGELEVVYPNVYDTAERRIDTGADLLIPATDTGHFAIIARPPLGAGALYVLVVPDSVDLPALVPDSRPRHTRGFGESGLDTDPAAAMAQFVERLRAATQNGAALEGWGYHAFVYDVAARPPAPPTP